MSRIATTFANLKKEKRAALIPFIMGGDPDLATSAKILRAVKDGGADLIEIGVPFSDPMADGPIIQAAGLRALASGTKLKGILAMVKEFRKSDNNTPIILMGYYNNFYHFGVEAFSKAAEDAGVDGLIIVDLPPEEEGEVKPSLAAHKLDLIRLIAPTSDDARMQALLISSSGFVYYISITGITGAHTASTSALQSQTARLKAHTKLPIAVGFGIKTAEQVKSAGMLVDAVVVGSALVDVIANADDKPKAAGDFVSSLKS